MKHPTSAALRAHWEACCSIDRLPDIASLRLQDLGTAVADTFTLDAPIYDGIYGFCGSALAVRYGRDLAGESFLARWSPPDRAALERHLSAMASGQSGIVLGMTAETAAGGFTAFEMLLLPISHRGRVGAVGSMARAGGHEDSNRIRARIVAQFLRSVRILPLEVQQPLVHHAAFAQRDRRRPVGRTHGHLTLLTGGK